MTFKRIVVLTGAGVSAESGMGTFRDRDGIWTRHSLDDVATPEGFARNPRLVHDFYNARRRALRDARPNIAHFALARLEQSVRSAGGDLMLVTQNVDNLHEKAGSSSLLHMHGELSRVMCASCGAKGVWDEDLFTDTECWTCGRVGRLRPDVVWFGEMPYGMDDIYGRLSSCDLFVSIGTSGEVYPAAGFVHEARRAGAHTVELNLEPSLNHRDFGEGRYGPATQVVDEWVTNLLRDVKL
ncbi:MAG TPA: Sir2 family NAD+-dependent deacetylase [Hyphomonadaceae bacterium]|nr:Sir2 family NAD+-dependent deacetylase [Hyphomonadaceae bacterium]